MQRGAMAGAGELLERDENREPAIRGFLHRPAEPNGAGVVLTHGAGSDFRAPLLAAVAAALAAAGYTVLRYNLAFRMKRPKGPPLGSGEADRASIERALHAMRAIVPGPVFAGGHSYGGRQSTILLADNATLAGGLLLLSYPLHPPARPAQLRTAHLPRLDCPALFVHGSDDPFGSPGEMRDALRLIPAPTELVVIEAAGHDLRAKPGGHAATAEVVIQAFQGLLGNDWRRMKTDESE